ncbi:hypothetical protein A1D31_22440 [Bradyrhizobium liaoningense]|nr:hypothetical protein A1D31_22440 [Bradyrhizobium liaoningense]
MTETLMQIRAPEPRPFSAGLVLQDGKVTQAPPIIEFMRGWNLTRVLAHCNKKGWKIATIRRPTNP